MSALLQPVSEVAGLSPAALLDPVALKPVPLKPVPLKPAPFKLVPLKPGSLEAVSPSRLPGPSAPETLHPALWLGHQLARGAEQALPSGFAALDAQLPGGGWPRRALTELLLAHAGIGEIRLLAPVLVAVQQAGRLVMLFDPPENLSATALAQLGFDVPQLLVIRSRAVDEPLHRPPPPGHLWALEQALKSGHVGALLAWLPLRMRGDQLRRLQLAAHAHDGPAFMLREAAARQRPSAAPLRLELQAGGADMLALRLLKRRGPPLESPLLLELQPVLSAAARRRWLAPRTASITPRQAADVGRRAVAEPRLPAAASAPPPLSAATFVNLA